MTSWSKALLKSTRGYDFSLINQLSKTDNLLRTYSEFVSEISKVASEPSLKLAGCKILIIGAGPAGLILARSAATQGAEVRLLERADDPRGDDSGYTNRSFNLTLDDVGRAVLGSDKAWRGGTWLKGRALHNDQNPNEVFYSLYGESPDSYLVSIPRPVLRQNLCNMAEDAGALISFKIKIESVDSNKAVVEYLDGENNHVTVQADLIVYADGIHSLADEVLVSQHNAKIELWAETRRYVNGMISSAANTNLSLSYIHFWHEPNTDNFTVGIPNSDKSVACLLVSPFEGYSLAKPFAPTKLVKKRLQQDFPRLCDSAPDIAESLQDKRCGQFWYKSVSQFRVGDKAVIVGDAGVSFPPWAGFGANGAMFSASALVYLLTKHPSNIERSLQIYQSKQLRLAELLRDFATEQGDFLSGPVQEDPSGRSDPALGPLLEKAYLPIKYTANSSAINFFNRRPVAKYSKKLRV